MLRQRRPDAASAGDHLDERGRRDDCGRGLPASKITYVHGNGAVESAPSGSQTVTTTGATVDDHDRLASAALHGQSTGLVRVRHASRTARSTAAGGAERRSASDLTLTAPMHWGARACRSSPASARITRRSTSAGPGRLRRAAVDGGDRRATSPTPRRSRRNSDAAGAARTSGTGSSARSASREIAAIVDPGLERVVRAQTERRSTTTAHASARRRPGQGHVGRAPEPLPAPARVQQRRRDRERPGHVLRLRPEVLLEPSFVVPSAVNQGDVVEFDGSATESTLMVPNGRLPVELRRRDHRSGPERHTRYGKGGTYRSR